MIRFQVRSNVLTLKHGYEVECPEIRHQPGEESRYFVDSKILIADYPGMPRIASNYMHADFNKGHELFPRTLSELQCRLRRGLQTIKNSCTPEKDKNSHGRNNPGTNTSFFCDSFMRQLSTYDCRAWNKNG